MENELINAKSKFNLENIETIYIGGGDPCRSPKILNLLLNILRINVTFNSIKEYTIECNPFGINDDLINVIKKHPEITRFSVGLQTLTNKSLKYCNRQVTDDLDLKLKSLSLMNIKLSIDLINGLPYSDINNDILELDKLIDMNNIKHLSLYDLTIEKGSFFYKNNIYVDEELLENNLLKYELFLRSKGFKRYEISNFAKDNEISEHNYNYWRYKNYLGVGPAAHSTIENIRLENKPSLDAYFSGNYQNTIILTKKEQIIEYLLMGFRLIEGININDFYTRFGLKLPELIKNTLLKNEYIYNHEVTETSILLKKGGLDILNRFLVDIIEELDNKTL